MHVHALKTYDLKFVYMIFFLYIKKKKSLRAKTNNTNKKKVKAASRA